MNSEVVEEDDLARHQRWQQALLDKGLEGLAVDRPVENHRRSHAGGGHAGQQAHALPAPPRHGAEGSLTAGGAGAQPRQAGGRGRLIEKDEALRGAGGQVVTPLLSRRGITLRGNQRLFLSGKPSRAKVRDMVAGLTVIPCVAAQVAQCSASVASGWLRTCARSASSASGPIWRCRPSRRRGPTVPVSRRCCRQRRRVRSLTPKVRVAAACPSPASRARSKRSPTSAEYCFIPAASHPGQLLCKPL